MLSPKNIGRKNRPNKQKVGFTSRPFAISPLFIFRAITFFCLFVCLFLSCDTDTAAAAEETAECIYFAIKTKMHSIKPNNKQWIVTVDAMSDFITDFKLIVSSFCLQTIIRRNICCLNTVYTDIGNGLHLTR